MSPEQNPAGEQDALYSSIAKYGGQILDSMHLAENSAPLNYDLSKYGGKVLDVTDLAAPAAPISPESASALQPAVVEPASSPQVSPLVPASAAAPAMQPPTPPESKEVIQPNPVVPEVAGGAGASTTVPSSVPESGEPVGALLNSSSPETATEMPQASPLQPVAGSAVSESTRGEEGEQGERPFVESSEYRRASSELRRNYSGMEPNGPIEVSAVGTRLMSNGGYKELGLSTDEARNLAAHYVRTLRSEHGSKSPRAIAEEVFSGFRRSGNQSQAKPGAITGSTETGRGDRTPAVPERSVPSRKAASKENNGQQPRTTGREADAVEAASSR